QAFFMKGLGDPLRSVTADVDDCIKPEFLDFFDELASPVDELDSTIRLWYRVLHRGSFVGCFQDGPALHMNSRRDTSRKLDDFLGLVPDAIECFDGAVDLPILFLSCSFCNSAYYSIEPWAIAAAGEYEDLLFLIHA